MQYIPTAKLASDVGSGVRAEHYDVEVVDTREALRAALPEWRDFIASNPRGCGLFNDPDIVEIALSQDGTLPYVMMVRRAGGLECIAPFGIHSTQFGLRLSVFKLASFPVRLLKLYGEDFLYSADADAAKCCSLVLEAIDFGNCDLVYLEALDTCSQLWGYCTGAKGSPGGLRFARPYRHLDKSFVLELPPSFAEYIGVLGSSTRSSIKRRTKKLLAEHGAKLTKVEAAEQIPAFLAAADAIYQDAWQSKTYGGAKRDRPAEIERLQQIARHGWLRCYLLESDLGPLAFQFGYRYRDTFYACDFAFVRQWADLGPGGVLMYMMLEDLYADSRPRFVDLGAGDSPQKHTFRGVSRDVADYWAIPRGRWRYVVAAQRCLSDIETTARYLLVRTGLDNAVRRVLKHKR